MIIAQQLAGASLGARASPVFSYLPFDGADAATQFPDAMGSIWTPSGNAQIDTAQSVFGGASGLFDGTGDGLLSPSSDGWRLKWRDWTLQLRVRFNSLSGSPHVVSIGNALTQRVALYYGSSALRWYSENGSGTGANRIAGPSLSTGTWYHVAVTHAGDTTRLFVDGTQVGSNYTGDVYYAGNCTACIANMQFGGGGNELNGWVDDFAFEHRALWTANFTPPAAALGYV